MCIFEFPDWKICDIFLIGVYFLRNKFQDHTTSSFLAMQICIFIFWKTMLQITSQNFPGFPFFSVTVKDMRLPDSQREINLVIFHLNYILIHFKHSPILSTKLRVSIRYNINDWVHIYSSVLWLGGSLK